MIRQAALALVLAAGASTAHSASLRVATYNVSLYFEAEGELVSTLADGQFTRARQLAAVIQRVRPDLLLLNEFDYDPGGRGPELFTSLYLGQGQFGETAIEYPYRFTAPVNTGTPSGVDLNGDGRVDGPADAHGWGTYPGQYGMLVLSRVPIDDRQVRTFQRFLWRDLPDPWWPVDPETGLSYYSDAARAVLRLSSKSHWDIPVQVGTQVLHFLVSHPTPPVFDGTEDRNGRRNHDEIRFWADYVGGADYPVDDQGRTGGLPPRACFVIAGDLNADPKDGDSSGRPILQLMDHPRVDASQPPASQGAIESARLTGKANADHNGPDAHDTAHFSGEGPGNLRIDYVLPSRDLARTGGGVFWPKQGESGSDWIEASDHRLVWIDLAFETSTAGATDNAAQH